MLIKISTGLPVTALASHDAPNFVLIDHAEDVEFGPATEFTSNKDLHSFGVFAPLGVEVTRHLNPHVEHAIFTPAGGYSVTERHRYIANSIAYTRKGQRHRVVFDGITYICTDEGKTLEKVWAGGGYNTEGPLEPAPSA